LHFGKEVIQDMKKKKCLHKKLGRVANLIK